MAEAMMDFGFLLVIDILDTSISNAAYAHANRYTARLTIGGVERKILSFTYEEPEGSMGATLQVQLQQPVNSHVTNSSSITFEIGVWNGSSFSYVTKLSNGKLNGKEYTLSTALTPQGARPTDTLNFSSVNPLSDRWQYAPRKNIVYYDPAKADLDKDTIKELAIKKEDGTRIQPERHAVTDLKLSYILDYAYKTGCEFTSVKHNLTNYRVARADFTMSDGYHAGAARLVSMFEPLYFADDANTLWIIDRTAPLPSGYTPRTINVSSMSNISVSTPATARVDGVLLTYAASTSSTDYSTTRVDSPNAANGTIIESGTFGTASYYREEVEKTVREWRNTSDPTTIRYEDILNLETTVYSGPLSEVSSVTTEQYIYDGLNRLTSIQKNVQGRVPEIVSGDTTLQTVQQENTSISYVPHPFNPRESVIGYQITTVTDLLLVDPSNTYLDQPYKIPMLDAHRNGMYIKDSDQYTETTVSKTIVERLQMGAGGQLLVNKTVTDHIHNTIERSTSQARTGEPRLDARSGRQETIFIPAEGTSGATKGYRIPTLNAGEMPRDDAIKYAKRWLRRQNNPPLSANFQLAALDMSVRRGTVFKPTDRSGASFGNFIVTGQRITGSLEGFTHTVSTQEILV